MHSSRVIHTVSAHAEGEVGDVIVGGVAPPARRYDMGAAELDCAGSDAPQFYAE